MASAAASKSFPNYFGGGESVISPEVGELDFNESDVWNSNMDAVPPSDQARRSMINNTSRPLKKSTRKISSGIRNPHHVNRRSAAAAAAATSLPVNVPEILGDGYKSGNRRHNEDDGDEEEEYGRLPPHEYLARTRGSSFSVHEGIGRTLKGRDLSRVRNAVWKQIGFED